MLHFGKKSRYALPTYNFKIQSRKLYSYCIHEATLLCANMRFVKLYLTYLERVLGLKGNMQVFFQKSINA